MAYSIEKRIARIEEDRAEFVAATGHCVSAFLRHHPLGER